MFLYVSVGLSVGALPDVVKNVSETILFLCEQNALELYDRISPTVRVVVQGSTAYVLIMV